MRIVFFFSSFLFTLCCYLSTALFLLAFPSKLNMLLPEQSFASFCLLLFPVVNDIHMRAFPSFCLFCVHFDFEIRFAICDFICFALEAFFNFQCLPITQRNPSINMNEGKLFAVDSINVFFSCLITFN